MFTFSANLCNCTIDYRLQKIISILQHSLLYVAENLLTITTVKMKCKIFFSERNHKAKALILIYIIDIPVVGNLTTLPYRVDS